MSEIRDILCDMGYDEAIVFDNPEHDDAIIGATIDGQAVYDYDEMVRLLVERDGMEAIEAVEFIEYNTIRALQYAGEHAPIIITRIMLDH